MRCSQERSGASGTKRSRWRHACRNACWVRILGPFRAAGQRQQVAVDAGVMLADELLAGFGLVAPEPVQERLAGRLPAAG